MARHVSGWLLRVSRGWVVLLALVIFLLFTVLVLPGQSALSDSVSGDVGSPDTSFFYAADDLYRMAEAYGAEGRGAYIRARFTFDVIWPLVYAGFLTTAISWLDRRAFAAKSGWQMVNLAPALGALLDYLENLSTSLVMYRYPARTALVDGLAPAFTALKWIFVAGSCGLLLIGMGAALWQWSRKSRKGT